MFGSNPLSLRGEMFWSNPLSWRGGGNVWKEPSIVEVKCLGGTLYRGGGECLGGTIYRGGGGGMFGRNPLSLG